jgi:hypothetical protein
MVLLEIAICNDPRWFLSIIGSCLYWFLILGSKLFLLIGVNCQLDHLLGMQWLSRVICEFIVIELSRWHGFKWNMLQLEQVGGDMLQLECHPIRTSGWDMLQLECFYSLISILALIVSRLYMH